MTILQLNKDCSIIVGICLSVLNLWEYSDTANNSPDCNFLIDICVYCDSCLFNNCVFKDHRPDRFALRVPFVCGFFRTLVLCVLLTTIIFPMVLCNSDVFI